MEKTLHTSQVGLSLDELWIASGDAVFTRALPYARSMTLLEESPGHAAGTSNRSNPYMVELWWGRSGIQGRCSCPHNALGNFCKHMCALGLLVLFRGRCDFIPSEYHPGVVLPSSVPNDTALDKLTLEEQQYFLSLVFAKRIQSHDIEPLAALKDISQPHFRFQLLDSVRDLFSCRYLPDPAENFFADVDRLLLQCEVLLFFHHGAFAYQLLDRALLRFVISLGSSLHKSYFYRGKDSFTHLLELHSKAAEYCSNVDQLVHTLVTLRETKIPELSMSFLPYKDALGSAGIDSLLFRVGVLKDRLSDPNTRVSLFTSVHIDLPRVYAQQKRELEVICAEAAYLAGDYDSVRRWAQPHAKDGRILPPRRPLLMALALAEQKYEELPVHAAALLKENLTSSFGAKSIDDPCLFTEFEIEPEWLISILGDHGFPEEAVSTAFRLFCDDPDSHSVILWKKALDCYSKSPSQDYASLFPWMVQNASHLSNAWVKDIFCALDDPQLLWWWEEDVCPGSMWEALLFSPLANRYAAPGQRNDSCALSWRPQQVQRALKWARTFVLQDVKIGHSSAVTLAETFERLRQVAQAADADLGVSTHVAWVCQLRNQVWALQTSSFHPSSPQKK